MTWAHGRVLLATACGYAVGHWTASTRSHAAATSSSSRGMRRPVPVRHRAGSHTDGWGNGSTSSATASASAPSAAPDSHLHRAAEPLLTAPSAEAAREAAEVVSIMSDGLIRTGNIDAARQMIDGAASLFEAARLIDGDLSA